MTRREFLQLLGKSAVAGPVFAQALGCAPGLTLLDSKTGLWPGYVAGDVTADGAVIWVRGEAGSNITLHYGPDPSLRDHTVIGPLAADPDADHSVLFHLSNLPPATRCYYRATVVGKLAGPVARFVTAPAADADAPVVFCFSGDTRDSYKPFTVMHAIREQHPDFFLQLGDTIYADRNGVARSLPEFWAKYCRNRDDAAARALYAETSVYVSWDDHEVADNYLPGHPLAAIGQKAFFDYWPIQRDPQNPGRLYRSFRWGKALELFVLDIRQYRDRRRGTMLGEAQKEWLLSGLQRSSAIFKFIATAVPMEGGGRDRWDGYPKERAELIGFIKQRKIPGVVFLSADLHCASVTRILGSDLRDITAGPLAAPLNRITDGTARRYDFFLAENFNFAKVTVDPRASRPQALIEFVDQDNQVFHSVKLYADGEEKVAADPAGGRT